MTGSPNPTAIAQLGQPVSLGRFFCWLDIAGDPLRATTAPAPVTFAGTGDPDLDGYTFDPVNPALVSITPASFQEGGADTVIASLSGLIGPDNDLLNIIGDATNWRGRTARLWMGVANEAGVLQGPVWSYFTGTMSSLSIRGSVNEQTIELSIETYLALLSPTTNRTYMDQAEFDPFDRSAEVAAATANAPNRGGLTPGLQGSGGGGRGGVIDAGGRVNLV